MCLGKCNNSVGGYKCLACIADPGLTDDCEDIDECADDALYDCPDGEECLNTDGSYACVCPDNKQRLTDGASCTGNKT